MDKRTLKEQCRPAKPTDITPFFMCALISTFRFISVFRFLSLRLDHFEKHRKSLASVIALSPYKLMEFSDWIDSIASFFRSNRIHLHDCRPKATLCDFIFSLCNGSQSVLKPFMISELRIQFIVVLADFGHDSTVSYHSKNSDSFQCALKWLTRESSVLDRVAGPFNS